MELGINSEWSYPPHPAPPQKNASNIPDVINKSIIGMQMQHRKQYTNDGEG